MDDFYRQLEADTRRPVEGDVLHPDACAKIIARGVAWAVPKRGISIAPVFRDGEVLVNVSDDPWPEAMKIAKAMPVTAAEVCGQCGRPLRASLSLDLGDVDFLTALFGLAARLLRKQYTLTDAQLTDLLAFTGDGPPMWVKDLLLWCVGEGR